MRNALQLLLLLAVSCGFLLADEGVPSNGNRDGCSPANGPASLPKLPADDEEPEEPDFAFVAGGPYTQKKNSVQFILPSQWGRRRSVVGGSILDRAEFGTLLRTEWGFTDRLELDLIVPAQGARERLDEITINSNFSLADAVLGARYRLLRESSAPFTLTTGPQIILPSGSPLRGTGFDTVGYAWDVAAARDWGGPLFLYTSFNYSFYPSVRDSSPGARRNFNLHDLFWGTALGLRMLEKPRGTSHHDIHLFLEYGLGRQETPGATAKVAEVQTVIAPGVRYGFLTRTKKLFEIGVSIPVGLNRNTPRGGVILQIQFENLFGYRREALHAEKR